MAPAGPEHGPKIRAGQDDLRGARYLPLHRIVFLA